MHSLASGSTSEAAHAGAGQLAPVRRRRPDGHGGRLARRAGPGRHRQRSGSESHGCVDGGAVRRPRGPDGSSDRAGGVQGARAASGRQPVGRVRDRHDPGPLRVRRSDRDDERRPAGARAGDGRPFAVLLDRPPGAWVMRPTSPETSTWPSPSWRRRHTTRRPLRSSAMVALAVPLVGRGRTRPPGAQLRAGRGGHGDRRGSGLRGTPQAAMAFSALGLAQAAGGDIRRQRPPSNRD